MISEYLFSFITGFVIGLPASLHCIGMCGGIFIFLSLQSKTQSSPKTKPASNLNNTTITPKLNMQGFPEALIINLGRVITYCILGLFAGLLGFGFTEGLELIEVKLIIRSLAGMVLMLIGLSMLGIEAFNFILSKIIEPVGVPIRKLANHLDSYPAYSASILKGIIWGFLPCGAVYAALTYAVLSADPYKSSLIMAGFGIATIPALLLIWLGSDFLLKSENKIWLTRLSGLILIIFSLLTFFAIDETIATAICYTN